MQRIFSPPIEMHASWLAVNSLQGCPKGCRYCFLRPWGQTQVKSKALLSPKKAVDELLNSDLYLPQTPLCLLTHTDPMATEVIRTHFSELLDEIFRRGLSNPVCFVTKCTVEDSIVERLGVAHASGKKVVAYWSLSGLDNKVERGVDHEKTRHSFLRLAETGVPIVHYWRPLVPENSTPDSILRVLDSVVGVAKCSVLTGLKLYSEMEGYADYWADLRLHVPELVKYEGVMPDSIRLALPFGTQKYPSHPIFDSNSCAIAYVLHSENKVGTYGTHSCILRSRCSSRQVDLCRDSAKSAESSSCSSFSSSTSQAAMSAINTGIAQKVEQMPNETYWASGYTASNTLLWPSRTPWFGCGARGRFLSFLDEMLQTALELRVRFRTLERTPWTGYAILQELSVQTGHLLHAEGLIVYGDTYENAFRDPARSRPLLADEFADCLLQVLALCSLLNIDSKRIHEAIASAEDGRGRTSSRKYLSSLAVIASQLLESTMRVSGMRNPHRGNESANERDFLESRILIYMSTLCTAVEEYGVDLVDAYFDMSANARHFIEQEGKGVGGGVYMLDSNLADLLAKVFTDRCCK